MTQQAAVSSRPKKTKYNVCSTVESLRRLPPGAIVRLPQTATLFKSMDNRIVFLDTAGESIRIQKNEKLNSMFGVGHHSVPPDFYVEVEHYPDTDIYSWSYVDMALKYHELKSGPCDCGASHTTFKDDHYSWCNSNIWE